MNKIKVKVFVEKAESGYSAYMDDSPLDYGCIGEGVTVEAAIEDFCAAYEEMKAYYATKGMPFTEAEFEFYYDTASFLAEYAGIFSLAGLENLQVSVKHNSVTICMADASRAEGLLIRFRKE